MWPDQLHNGGRSVRLALSLSGPRSASRSTLAGLTCEIKEVVVSDKPKAAQAVTSKAPNGKPDAAANTKLSDFTKAKNAADEKKAATKVVKQAKDGRPKLPPLPRKAGAAKPMVDCACGCGLKTHSKFAPGHDSRLRGWALRLARELTTYADIESYAGKGERDAVEAFVRQLKKEGKFDALKTPTAPKKKAAAAAE